ncbi:MAG: glycosyltransferase [Actinobacteria bacterium]|nr:glycosyltransferase [Actinomycetota bacterium]
MKVSVVATVLDAGERVGAFLDALGAQTRAPDEIVVVDGGSTDGTLDALRGSPGIVLVEEPGANIARGRNVAVAAATHDVIAVTDADCVPAPDWLERLLAPIERGADVAMGFYHPLGDSVLQIAAASVLPDRDELREGAFLPSARSVAFRRGAFLAGGGYPEWLDVGEDMYLDLQWRRLGVRMDLASDALVGWPIRATLGETWRQYVRYAEGDAVAGMHAARHAIRFAAYGAAALALSSGRRGAVLVTLAAAAARASRPVRRAVARARRDGRNPLVVGAVTPAVLALIDAAKMAGYLRGRARRRAR